jgi:hypothetical protein
VRIVEDLDDLTRQFAGERRPLLVATSARMSEQTIPYGELRQRIFRGEHVLLLFGTAWGLAREALERTDLMLPPIQGYEEYRHLSVRSAVAIILDRLLGRRE